MPDRTRLFDASLRQLVIENLSHFKADTGAESAADNSQIPLIKAAVVLVISQHTESKEACIYLTLRSSKLRKHAGQFALPGGKIDSGETIPEAALRELSEELGIAAHNIEVLGLIDDFHTRSGFTITPVVVWNNGGDQVQPNPDEVARVYQIPLSELLVEDLIDLQQTAAQPILSISPHSVGTTIYSPTAAIIFQFREVALLGRDTRVSHYEQPGFAWR